MVSVIIPNYNHAKFLRQRIDTVLNQTYKALEIIILDDASTDGSIQIIEEYRTQQGLKKIVYNDTNSGSTFKQWEKGIKLAEGKYIWIAESDDYCTDDFLENAVKEIELNGTDVHYCQSQLVDENGNILEKTLKWPTSISAINWEEPFKMKGSDFINIALRYKNVIPNASAVVFLKQDFDFGKLYKLKSTGDWLFWIKILLKGNVSFSSKVLNSFRSHSATTRSGTEHKKILLRYLEELFIRYYMVAKYGVGDKAELDRFYGAIVSVANLEDAWLFYKFCYKFQLPSVFLLRFLKRKLLK